MTVVEGPRSTGLLARVQNILLRPKAEWEVIDGEAATTRGLFTGYACLLAAIPAVAGLIGRQLFGFGAFGISYHPALVGSIVGAIVAYGLSLVSVFILALVIDALAPSFDGHKSQIQAMKVAVYSSTAAWIAGIFDLFPPLGIIGGLCALYGLYLLYLGLPRLMKAPQEKALGYTVVTIVAAIVLYIIVGAVVAAVASAAVLGTGAGAYTSVRNDRLGGTVRVGATTVDLAKLQAASAQMAAAAQAAQTGRADGKTVAAIDPEKLKALLPVSVAGLPRTEISATGMGAGGAGASSAEATYAKDAARITLTVSDLAAAQGLAAMAGALNVNSSRETATGYEKVASINGRMTTERWDRASRDGEYSIIVAGRFAVAAQGQGGSIDDLKAAVNAVGPDRLEGLAKS